MMTLRSSRASTLTHNNARRPLGGRRMRNREETPRECACAAGGGRSVCGLRAPGVRLSHRIQKGTAGSTAVNCTFLPMSRYVLLSCDSTASDAQVRVRKRNSLNFFIGKTLQPLTFIDAC